jgi:hypothetical protein
MSRAAFGGVHFTGVVVQEMIMDWAKDELAIVQLLIQLLGRV